MATPTDLRPTTDELTRIVSGISDEMLGRPTPCPQFTVGEVVDHCLGLALAFTAGARKESLPGGDGPPPPPSAAHLPDDWREELPRRLDELAQAWADPSAVEGVATVGGVTIPGGVMNLVALDEVVLHGWDLAVSTGQPYRPDETALRVVHGFLTESTMGNPDGTPGLFGPVVAVPADGPLLDRALGLSGRDPAWQPQS